MNVEESPSRFTLEGLHDRAVSEVVKEEITLDDHDRIATLQVNIRSAVEVSPRHSIVTQQCRATKGKVMCGVGAWSSIPLIRSSMMKQGQQEQGGGH